MIVNLSFMLENYNYTKVILNKIISIKMVKQKISAKKLDRDKNQFIHELKIHAKDLLE